MLNRRSFLKRSSLLGMAAWPAARAWSGIIGPTPTIDRDLDAITGDGRQITLTRAAVQELGASLRGNLLLPGVPAYEQARRVLNAQMDKHPALIIQPRGASDVSSAVQFARTNNLLLAVKCGGHSPSGKSTCERGMLVDLSLLRGVSVDPQARIARVAGGSLLGDMDQEAMAHGLVTTAGTVSHTGVGGLTLGGGFGRLARRFGLALDNVRAVEIVTANGDILYASPLENPDLYWGVRGGGGNFGVVTSFEFALHPMQRQVFGGSIFYPMAQARNALDFYAQFQEAAPDDVTIDAIVGSNLGFSGLTGVGLLLCYSGAASGADKLLAKLRSLGKPILDGLGPVDYVALQRSGDGDDKRAIGSYTKTGFIRKLSPQLIDVITNGFEADPERATTLGFQSAGGAISRVASDATAFPYRDIHATTILGADWPATSDPERHIRWARQFWAAIFPHTNGFYTNDVIEESQQQVNENYAGNFPRLVKIKNQYDPTNLFRLNANIPPKV